MIAAILSARNLFRSEYQTITLVKAACRNDH